MKTDNDTMTGAERLVLAAGAGLLPFFLLELADGLPCLTLPLENLPCQV